LALLAPTPGKFVKLSRISFTSCFFPFGDLEDLDDFDAFVDLVDFADLVTFLDLVV